MYIYKFTSLSLLLLFFAIWLFDRFRGIAIISREPCMYSIYFLNFVLLYTARDWPAKRVLYKYIYRQVLLYIHIQYVCGGKWFLAVLRVGYERNRYIHTCGLYSRIKLRGYQENWTLRQLFSIFPFRWTLYQISGKKKIRYQSNNGLFPSDCFFGKIIQLCYRYTKNRTRELIYRYAK